jgi:hypothetical protein
VHNLHDDELRQADLLIFAFGRPTQDEWSQFRRVCGVRKDRMPVRVIARLRGFHDAVFHLMVEKLADRVVYEHE